MQANGRDFETDKLIFDAKKQDDFRAKRRCFLQEKLGRLFGAKRTDYHVYANALENAKNNFFASDGLVLLQNCRLKQASLETDLYNKIAEYINACIDFHFRIFVSALEMQKAIGSEIGIIFHTEEFCASAKKVRIFLSFKALSQEKRTILKQEIENALTERLSQAETFVANSHRPAIKYELEKCKKQIKNPT